MLLRTVRPKGAKAATARSEARATKTLILRSGERGTEGEIKVSKRSRTEAEEGNAQPLMVVGRKTNPNATIKTNSNQVDVDIKSKKVALHGAHLKGAIDLLCVI